MKTLRNVLLGLMLAAAMTSGAYAHEPRVGLSFNLGYPAYVAPPPVYYAPPPPVIYAPPPPRVYLPAPYVVPSYGYRPYVYDYGPRHGGHRHGHRHHHHHH
jgi:hypothetical protein